MHICSIEPLENTWIEKIEKTLNSSVYVIHKDSFKTNKMILQNTEILIGRDRDISIELLEYCKNLKFIFIVSVGVEKLPFEYLKTHKIQVANSAHISDQSISDYVIGAMLLHNCKFKKSILNQQKHYWEKFVTTSTLQNKKILIVGAGKIGKTIAQKLVPFNTYTIGVKQSKTPLPNFNKIISLDEISNGLSYADFVICSLPLTEKTKYLFNENLFSKMSTRTVFINISRGQLVNQNDLIKALENKTISGAILDVFENEPLEIDSKLWELENVIITPHSSGRINNFLQNAIDIFLENAVQYINFGNLKTAIDLDKYY